jgi:hypothetical protein
LEAARFETLIKDMCRAAGLADADAVFARGHVVVEDRVVGFAHDEEDFYSNVITISVELDRVAPAIDPEIYLRILSANARRRAGFFAVHPERGTAIYRIDIDARPGMSGNDLARSVHAQVFGATAEFEEIKSDVRNACLEPFQFRRFFK